MCRKEIEGREGRMRYEPHRLRAVLESLRRPLDARFNRALDEVLLVLEPFEELETWLIKRYEELEERVEKLESLSRDSVLDAKEEAQEEEKETD